MKKIGFVGYSDENKYDEQKAKDIISVIFDKIMQKYCQDPNGEPIAIVSGATNQGIPRLVYEQADAYNAKYGKWFMTIGISAKEAYTCQLYPCDNIIAYGEKFGDESKMFIQYIDELYKIGGGRQSQHEFDMARAKNIPTTEYIL